MSNTIAKVIDADNCENASHDNINGNETKKKRDDRFRRYRVDIKPLWKGSTIHFDIVYHHNDQIRMFISIAHIIPSTIMH